MARMYTTCPNCGAQNKNEGEDSLPYHHDWGAVRRQKFWQPRYGCDYFPIVREGKAACANLYHCHICGWDWSIEDHRVGKIKKTIHVEETQAKWFYPSDGGDPYCADETFHWDKAFGLCECGKFVMEFDGWGWGRSDEFEPEGL